MLNYVGMGNGNDQCIKDCILGYIVIIVQCILYFFIFFISRLLWEKCYLELVIECMCKIIGQFVLGF